MSERAEASGSAFWRDADDAEALQRYRALVNAVDDGICQLDADCRFVAVNDAIVETTGFAREDLLGEHASVLLDAEDASTLEREVERLLGDAAARTEPLDLPVRTADGDRVVWELGLNALADDGGVRGVVGVVRDATGRKRTERELDEYRERERELERYEAIVEAVNDGVYVVDGDGRFTMVNEAYTDLVGYDREELLGEHVSLVVDEEVRRQVERTEATMRDGEVDRPVIEAELETASGERVPTEATFALLPGSDEQRRVGVVRDVSQRKERERALEERERQLSTLMENVPGMVYRCRNEPGWPMEFVSDACEEVTGYDPDAVERGEVSWGEDVMVAEDRAATWEEVQAAVERRETFTVTYRIETADGDRRWVRSHGRGVFDEDGDVTAVEGIVSDVTERKRLEAELDEMFGRVTDAFYALDDRWRITHANERAEELIDYEGEGLVGRDFWEVFEWAADSTLGEEYRTAMEAQEPTSFEFYYPEPLDAWYEVHAYPSETGLSVYFRDVSERKRFEDALAALHDSSRELFRAESAEAVARGVVEAGTEVLELSDVALYLHDDERGDLFPAAKATDEGFMWDELPRISPDDSTIAGHAFASGETVLWDDIRESPNVITTDTDMRSGVYVPIGDYGVVFAGSSTVGAFDERTRQLLELLGANAEVAFDRVERQRELEESERRYRTLAEYFPNGLVTLFDHDFQYTLAAGQGFDRIPVEPDDLEGNSFRDVWDDGTADALEPAFQAALAGEEESVELEYAGREWILHAVPITDERGEVFAGMTMAQDITEQKERERYLREAKSQLEAATEAGAVGTWEWHIPEDEFVTGASFARTFGVDPDAAREGVPLDRVVSSIHEDDRRRIERRIEAAMESCGEYEEEYRVWDADGELRWVVARGHVECDEDGNPVRFPGALTDITERKRAEEELDEHRRQLETLFEVLPVGVVVADGDGGFVEANETAKELWGGDVFDAETVAEYDRYRGWWADTGEPVAPDEWTMARVLRGEEVTEPDVFEIEAADGERRIVMVHGMPVREADGEVTRGVVTLTDITERREYQRQLEESNDRLESFASMLAHELRNPVTIGQIYSQQLPDEAAPDAVEYVTEAFDRIEDMIDVMLVLTRGRKAVGERSPLSIPAVTSDAWDSVDAPEASLTVEVDAVMEADETYVRHLFRNLFENAVQHGGEDVTVRVGELPSGFYVADDGAGIPADRRDAVFETGFTTAGDEGGTGLGLAFVEKLADVYDWECSTTESESGGARFEFRNVDLEPPA